jgi:hypothetical protein
MLVKVESPRSEAEMRDRYRDARRRLLAQSRVAPSQPVLRDPITPVADVPPPTMPPRLAIDIHAPLWHLEMEDFNEQLRALFCGDLDAYVRPFNGRTVRAIVAAHFGIAIADLCGNSLARRYTWPRQIGMYICTTVGMNELAAVRVFGRHDHTTARYASRRVRTRMSTDVDFAIEVGALIEQCRYRGTTA